MSTITESVDVAVDVSTAYNQWTQFESFPQFMEGVEEIRQIDDTHTHWVTSIAGVTREFDATITEQNPDERVAWRSDEGPNHAGVITFTGSATTPPGSPRRWTSILKDSPRMPPTSWAFSSGGSKETCAGSRSSSSRALARRLALGAARCTAPATKHRGCIILGRRIRARPECTVPLGSATMKP